MAWAAAAHGEVLQVETSALQPQFTVYGTDHGLPSNQIRTLHQDGSGMLWIGTYGGLASFDGSSFETWRAPQDPRPLVVEAIAEDLHGNLWITAEKRGVYRLDAARSQWTHYGSATTGDTGALRSDDIWALAADAGGGLWLGGYGGGLHYIDAQGKVLTDAHPSVPQVPGDQIGALMVGVNGLWIGTGEQGLWFLPDGATRAQPCEPEVRAAVSSLRRDGDHGYVTFNDGRVLRLGADCASLRRIYQAANSEQIALSVLPENGAVTALGLRNGMAWAEPGREALAWLKTRPGTPGALPPGIGQALLKDREGGYWVGVHGGGLAYLPPGADKILFVPHDGGSFGGLRGRSIRGLSIAPDGGMWVGSTDFGLERVDASLSRVASWTPPAQLPLRRFSVLALASWKQRLWIAHREGLWSAPMLGSDLGEVQALELPGVHLLQADGEHLWAAARADALYKLDAAGRVVSRFAPGQLAGHEINQMLLDPEGVLWIATDGGTQRFDAELDRLDFDPRIAYGDVASMCFQDNSLWRYSDAGLEHFDRHQRHLLRRYESADGIPPLDTASLQCRGEVLWLLTRSGFLAWSPAQGKVLHEWRRADGVPAVELGRSTFGEQHHGRYWTGGEGGLLGLTLRLPAPQELGFTLRLQSIRTQRGEQWLQLDGPHIQLQAQDRNLHLLARATLFRAPGSTRYSFRFTDAAGATQTFTSQSGELDIARLGAGEYRLLVDATHPRLGSALHKPELGITVLPYWYQTWWARLGAALLLLGLAAALFENQRRRLKARHERQLGEQRLAFAEHLAEEKSRFLAQASHEMKNLLGGATGMAELIAHVSAQTGVRDKAQRMLDLCRDLSRLLDDLLDNARLERGQISLSSVVFDPLALLRALHDEYSARAQQKGLQLQLELPVHAAQRQGDALRLRQIVGNLLSNAVKYTEQGGIWLSAQLEDPALMTVSVRDSGPGIDAQTRERLFEPFSLGRNRRDSTGLGLWICQQLCQRCGGAIQVHSDTSGSCFTVTLPWVVVSEPARQPRLVVVATAVERKPWLVAAEQLGMPASGAETLLALLAEPQEESVDGPSAPIRVLMPGASAEDLLLATQLLAARGYRMPPQGPPTGADPTDYLRELLASSI